MSGLTSVLFLQTKGCLIRNLYLKQYQQLISSYWYYCFSDIYTLHKKHGQNLSLKTVMCSNSKQQSLSLSQTRLCLMKDKRIKKRKVHKCQRSVKKMGGRPFVKGVKGFMSLACRNFQPGKNVSREIPSFPRILFP